MKYDLFWMIGELKSNKVGLTDLAAAGNIREAELQVIEDVGGINNPALSRLYRQTVKQTVNRADNEVSLPDGAGAVIQATVGDILYTVLRTEDEVVHGKSILHQHSAVIDGGDVRFLGLPKGNVEASVIIQRPTANMIYVEGLRVFKSTRRFSRKGVSNPTFVVEFPSYQQFEKDSLNGGTLRIAKTGSMAEDREIAKNEFIGRELFYVSDSMQSAPISWVNFLKTEAIPFSDEERVTTTALADIQIDPLEKFSFPAVIAKTNMPDTLRPLVLILARYKTTNAPQFHAEYTQAIERWRRSNAG